MKTTHCTKIVSILFLTLFSNFSHAQNNENSEQQLEEKQIDPLAISTFFGMSPREIYNLSVFGKPNPKISLPGKFGASYSYRFTIPTMTRDTYKTEIGFDENWKAVYFIYEKMFNKKELSEVEVQGLLAKSALKATWKNVGEAADDVTLYKAELKIDEDTSHIYFAALPNHKKRLFVYHPFYTPQNVDTINLASVNISYPKNGQIVSIAAWGDKDNDTADYTIYLNPEKYGNIISEIEEKGITSASVLEFSIENNEEPPVFLKSEFDDFIDNRIKEGVSPSSNDFIPTTSDMTPPNLQIMKAPKKDVFQR